MTALQILGLILFIVALAGVLGFLFQAGKDTEDQEPYIKPAYTKEELENIKLAEELYNKDLRPEFVPSGLSSTPVSPEFPNVGKDLTKVFPTDAAINTEVKVAEELTVTQPEFVAKVVETSKVLPPKATINAEAVVEKVKETKSEFPIDKPKKKRKPRTKVKK